MADMSSTLEEGEIEKEDQGEEKVNAAMTEEKARVTEEEEGQNQMSHQQAMSVFKSRLASLIENDPLLCDLPPEVTLEELNSEIALEYGQAMTVNVKKGNDEVLPVVVVQNATVLDLKKAIQRYIILQQTRLEETRHVSWSYVWGTYWLVYDGEKLANDNKLIKDYGIRNRDEVTFLKRLRQK